MLPVFACNLFDVLDASHIRWRLASRLLLIVTFEVGFNMTCLGDRCHDVTQCLMKWKREYVEGKSILDHSVPGLFLGKDFFYFGHSGAKFLVSGVEMGSLIY